MELFSDETRRNPYPLYDQLRASRALHVPGPNLYLLFSYDAVKRALTDHEAFSSNVGPTRGHTFQWLLFMDPPRHTKLRAIISRAFTPKSIAGLETRIREISAGLLAPLHGEIDLVADYAAPLPMMVIAEMLGLPTADWRKLSAWSEAIVNLGNTISGVGADAANAAFATADAEMTAYFKRALSERRDCEDLLTRLATAEVDGDRLTDYELVRFCQLLLAAGTETTTNLIDNAMLCLLEDRGALARVRADASLIPRVIEETLRFRAPVQAMFRATTREVDIGGTRIPAGQLVVATIGAANRDAEQFADPHRFDLDRDPNPHLAFGHGIHFCLGAPLSRLEGRVALGDLLAHFDQIELATPHWQPRAAFHVHGPRALHLRVARR